jgi:hypothetical protein
MGSLSEVQAPSFWVRLNAISALGQPLTIPYLSGRSASAGRADHCVTSAPCQKRSSHHSSPTFVANLRSRAEPDALGLGLAERRGAPEHAGHMASHGASWRPGAPCSTGSGRMRRRYSNLPNQSEAALPNYLSRMSKWRATAASAPVLNSPCAASFGADRLGCR